MEAKGSHIIWESDDKQGAWDIISLEISVKVKETK